MATTYTLKRKLYAAPEEEQKKKKSGIGKKIAIGAGATALAAGALAAQGARKEGDSYFQGVKNLGTKMAGAFQGAQKGGANAMGATKAAATSFGRSFAAGGKNLVGAVGGLFNKNSSAAATPAAPTA